MERLRFIKTAELSVIDNLIVLTFQVMMLALILIILHDKLFIGMDFWQMDGRKYVIGLLLMVITCMSCLTAWDTFKIIRFKKRTKGKETFLVFDNVRMSAYTKDGDFSVSYQDVADIHSKDLWLSPRMHIDSMLIEVVVKKERLTWFEKLWDKQTTTYELYIPQEETAQVHALLHTFYDYKEKSHDNI